MKNIQSIGYFAHKPKEAVTADPCYNGVFPVDIPIHGKHIGWQPPLNQHGQNEASRTGNYIAAKKTVSETAFEESKLSTAKSIAASNCLSTDQVVALCEVFSFEESKLTFAKYAYKYTTDPKNYFKVNNVFSFDSNKDELNKFISGD